jgi:hypothetical protein
MWGQPARPTTRPSSRLASVTASAPPAWPYLLLPHVNTPPLTASAALWLSHAATCVTPAAHSASTRAAGSRGRRAPGPEGALAEGEDVAGAGERQRVAHAARQAHEVHLAAAGLLLARYECRCPPRARGLAARTPPRPSS